MKNILFFTSVALVLALTSCKKELTCECTNTYTQRSSNSNGQGTSYTSPPATTTTTYKKVKKSKMGTICGDSRYEVNEMSTNDGVTTNSYSISEFKCTIK